MPSLGHNFGKGQGPGEEGDRCFPLIPVGGREGGATLTVMSKHVASVLLGQGLVSRSASTGVCLTESERAKDGQDE